MMTTFHADLDSFARKYLRSTAARLDATVPCIPCGEDDYLQDLQLNLCRRKDKFDENRASWPTFVRLVTDHRAIELRQKCRTGRCQAMAPVNSIEWPAEIADHAFPSEERRILELDMAAWIASLDPDEQKLCRLLMKGSVSEAARKLNSPRTTIIDKISRMRKRFESSSLKDLAPRSKNSPTLRR